MRVDLYPFQRDGIERISRFGGRALLADEMGLGKTAQALVWMRENAKPPCIVICPASLKINWAREAWKFIRTRSEILQGRKPPKGWKPCRKLIIINYDILAGWINKLTSIRPILVIVDECHYIKSRGSRRTISVRSLCKSAKFVIGMSGTPLTNRPEELFPILNIIRGDKYNSFISYAWEFCDPKHNRYGWDFTGSKNLGGLHKQLSNTCMIRRKKKDVLKDLPAKSRFVIPMQIDGQEYRHAENNFNEWYRNRGKNVSRANQYVRVGELKRYAAQLRLPSSIEWIENFLESSDGKLIVFGIHWTILGMLNIKFRKMCVSINGIVTGKKRQLAVDRFQKSSKIRLLIGNIQAAGLGLNLTAADSVVFVEMGWTPGEHAQAEARPHRIGQRNPVSCYYLVAEGTIEEDVCRIIDRKQRISDDAIDGGKKEDQKSVLDLLLEGINRRRRRSIDEWRNKG